MAMDKLDQAAFLELFHEEVRDDILANAKTYRATHMVCYENQNLSSSALGDRSALPVGPNNTLKTLEETEGHWLNDLPSLRQHPKCYMEVEV